jgi:PAS domain S-box-containing protein
MREPADHRLADLRRQNQDLTCLCRLTSEIARLGEESATLKKIVDTAARLVGVDGAHVALVDRDERSLYGLVSSGRHRDDSPHLKLELSQSEAAREALRSRKVVTIERAAADPRVNAEARDRLGIGGIAYLPLLSGKVSFGLLILCTSMPHRFTAAEQELAGHFANLAAVALENSRLMNHLVETEQRLRSLIEHIPAIVYVSEVDPPYRTIYVSPQIGSILGIPPEVWTSDQSGLFMKLLHPDDAGFIIDWTSEATKARGFATAEYRLRDKWGEYRWLRDEAVMVRDPSSNPVAWHGVIVEITGIKRAAGH